MRRCISEPTTRFPRPAPRSVATSASTTPSALIRALTGKRQTMLTSVACSRSRQPEPGRGATYLNRNAVQTNRATADVPDDLLGQRCEDNFPAGERRDREGHAADAKRRHHPSVFRPCTGRIKDEGPVNPQTIADQASRIADEARALALQAQAAAQTAVPANVAHAVEPFIFLFAIFLMACFVGYYVVWNVTPALHSPLMAVTDAVSFVIIVGAMLATGLGASTWATVFGVVATALASVNILGGFVVTQRMLSMFKSKK